MILCSLCGKHNATIYFKGIADGQAIKLRVCEPCARKKGLVFPFAKTIFSLGDMIAGLAAATHQHPKLMGASCQKCGLTYAELRQTSQLGCSQCYATFASVLGPLFKNLQGSDQHVGKNSRATVRAVSPLQELERSKVELREAVRREEYELAATLRDKIREIEHQMVALKEPR